MPSKNPSPQFIASLRPRRVRSLASSARAVVGDYPSLGSPWDSDHLPEKERRDRLPPAYCNALGDSIFDTPMGSVRNMVSVVNPTGAVYRSGQDEQRGH